VSGLFGMNDITDRPLKELFSAVYNDQLRENRNEIRADQEKVLNELLNQPADFKNKIAIINDGLEIDTLREHILYIHTRDLESRVVKRKAKNNIQASAKFSN
jgi:hypothetical protein